MQYEILRGDCIEQMRAMPDNSFDSIVCDPPYELGFMGKAWDASGIAYSVEMWREALRVLKPGGHLLAFSGSRTYHRMTCAIEDAGFEVRDQIFWVYGSGFPKSLDVSKAIDKARHDNVDWKLVGVWLKAARLSARMTARDLCAAIGAHGERNNGGAVSNWELGLSCPTWEQWQGMRAALSFSDEMDAEVWRLNGRKGTPGEAWGEREVVGVESGSRLAVAPGQENDRGALELRITAPATDAARQWEGWGTALKPAHEPICVARKPLIGTVAANVLQHGTGALNIDGCRVAAGDKAKFPEGYSKATGAAYAQDEYSKNWTSSADKNPGSRWPANLIHDGSDEVVALFPVTTSGGGDRRGGKDAGIYGAFAGDEAAPRVFESNTGSAARFFYCAKASKSDRGPNNTHPTVKPLALMQYLVRLVTPPGGLVLDPFAGSGSTIVAALREGFRATGIELLDEHATIIEGRMDEELYGDIL